MSNKRYKPIAMPIKTGNTSSVLASFFRDILFDLNVTTGKFSVLLENYMRRSNLPDSLITNNNFRNNLKKDLLKSTMTWKVFIKGLVFLSVTKMDISIRLHYKDGRSTAHNKTIVIDNVELEENKNVDQ